MLQKPKGTYDIFGKKAYMMIYLKNVISSLMDKYNVKFMEAPIFEYSELFHRGVGETTDIVSKETYDFKDRGDRNLTLRPEGTAGIVRSFVENKLYALENPSKFWYFGPMFRYERPQAGRYRQFYQFGFEAFGSYSPVMDAEVISIVYNFIKILGLKGVRVRINTLGDRQSRDNYRGALLDYFKPHLEELCEDCNRRYEKNPLRIIDCKVDSDKVFMKDAPKMIDYLNEDSLNHFEMVKKYLNDMNIDYEIDSNIVRGLDYYTHTVFEVQADIKGFGSQNVLAGGGRYNNLVENIGGPSVPGVGFAVGIERLLLALEFEGLDNIKFETNDIYIFSMTEDKGYMMSIANNLRINGFSAEIDYDGKNIKNNFKKADKLNSKFVIIIGDEEISSKVITVKNNKTKEEYKIKEEDLISFFSENLGDIDEN